MFQDGLASTPPRSALKKDDDYFLEFVVIQVEDVLFRVPTHRFINESDFFAKMSRSNAKGADSKGSSECNPIRFREDVRSKDFKSLLKLLYPKTSTDRILKKDEWISILRLATRWYFLNVREIAIKELEKFKFSHLENIILGREMYISKRLIEGYIGVVASPNTISDKDAVIIGWQTALKLCRLREERTSRKFSSWAESVPMQSQIIRVALKDELSGILAQETLYDTEFDYQSD